MPDPFKSAFAPLKRVGTELSTVRRLASHEYESSENGEAARERAAEVLAAAELTYLLRLFAAFEHALTLLGPHLRNPRTFTRTDTLATKLSALGADATFAPSFRDEVDRDLRDLRNELSHGRSLIPRLPFDHVEGLMRSFIRGLF